MSRQGLWRLLACLLPLSLAFALRLAAQAPPPERPIEERLDLARVQLDLALQDHARCKQDYAELWVQSRKLSLDYQQVVKERDALKPVAPKEPAAPVSPTN